jgi:predicted Zn-dependent protease
VVRRAATIAIHEIGHNCGLDHHGYDEGISCVMTADTELDCLERLDDGTHDFCRACQQVVDRKLVRGW